MCSCTMRVLSISFEQHLSQHAGNGPSHPIYTFTIDSPGSWSFYPPFYQESSNTLSSSETIDALSSVSFSCTQYRFRMRTHIRIHIQLHNHTHICKNRRKPLWLNGFTDLFLPFIIHCILPCCMPELTSRRYCVIFLTFNK